MPITYPPPAPTITGDVEAVNRFLSEPARIYRRFRTVLTDRFISDALLTQRFLVEGGAIVYETTGEAIYLDGNPMMVAPGGEYPLAGVPTGPESMAVVRKWGIDTPVTDESIKRRRRSAVDIAMTKLANSVVRTVDGVAISAIASAVTATQSASATAANATVEQVMFDFLSAKNTVDNAGGEGYDADTVVLSDLAWIRLYSKFVGAGVFNRGTDQIESVSAMPIISGMRFLRAPVGSMPFANSALVLDSQRLGGMADEDLGGPGYTAAPGQGLRGIEAKAIREDKIDQWLLRGRRVTVPVITDPLAAIVITGVGA